MIEIGLPASVDIPDIKVDHLPPLHSLINNFGKSNPFLGGYLDFLKELKTLNAPTEKPSFWPLRYPYQLDGYFQIALDKWGPRDRRVKILPIRDNPEAIVYLSGSIPVLYREIARMTPRVDGMRGAPLPPQYAAAIGYNAAYGEFCIRP